jgi:hypothetical protein
MIIFIKHSLYVGYFSFSQCRTEMLHFERPNKSKFICKDSNQPSSLHDLYMSLILSDWDGKGEDRFGFSLFELGLGFW